MKKYILLLAAAGLMSSCYDLDQYPELSGRQRHMPIKAW